MVGLVEAIETEVTRRGLGPGDKLPTERDWVAVTGQSRTAVRQALAALEARGRVVRQVGRGTYLAAAPGSSAGDELLSARSSSPAEILAVRLLLEPPSMHLAVAAARTEDLAEIERCLVGGEQETGFEQFEQWDAAFHRALAASTHNSLLVRLCDMVNAARDQPLWGRLKRRTFTAQRRLDYCRDHRAVAEALADRDATTAARALREHLLRVRDNTLGQTD